MMRQTPELYNAPYFSFKLKIEIRKVKTIVNTHSLYSVFPFHRPLLELLQQLAHAPVRHPHIHRLMSILHPYIATPDELHQLRQGVIIVIKLQDRIILRLGPLGQEVGTGHIKITVAQIGHPDTVTVIVGGLCIAGQKTLRRREMPAVAADQIPVRIENRVHKRIAAHTVSPHILISVTETVLQLLQLAPGLLLAGPLEPVLGQTEIHIETGIIQNHQALDPLRVRLNIPPLRIAQESVLDHMVILHIDMVQQAILVQHTVMGHVRKEPALPETLEHLPFCKSHNGSELPVLFPVRIQSAAAAETSHRVEHLVLRNLLFIFAGRIILNHAIAADDHLLLLHQLHIRRAEPDHATVLVRLQPAAHHIPEKPGHLVEVGSVIVLALLKGLDGVIIEKTPQGMGGDDVVTVQDHVPDALAVRPVLRRLHPQILPETLIPLAEGWDKDDVTVVFLTPEMTGFTEPEVIDQRLALPHAHGRIHNAEGKRGFVVGITAKNKNTSCCEDAVPAGNTCRRQRNT